MTNADPDSAGDAGAAGAAGDDATELSARNKEAEDVTLISARVRSQLPSEDDEFTLMSARHLAAEEDTADATRVAKRVSSAAPAAPARRSKLSSLPPGSIGGAVAERGGFGRPAEEYIPRSVPDLPIAQPAAAAPVPRDVGVQEASKVRARQEAARHRRLISAAVIVALTAAIITGAILGIVALLTGSD